jgi:hypothetical protein
MRDMEGKVTRVGASERGQRASFKTPPFRDRGAGRPGDHSREVACKQRRETVHEHRVAHHHSGLRSARHRSLLAKMPKPKPRKKLRPRGPAGVKGSASRGRGKKWILILLVVLLFIPAMQVAVVRFINPPLTLPMLIDQGSAMFSSTPKPPLRYRWISLPHIPEMFLEHLWISEDQRFFQHEGFDWKEMDLAVEEAERKGKPQPRSIISASARAVLRGTNRQCWRPSCRIRKAGTRRSRAGGCDGVSAVFCNVNAARISLRSRFIDPA